MKPFLPFLLGIILSIIFPLHPFAQCGPGMSAHTVKYDTTVYGGGTASYSFSLPQFNIPLGVLLSADVKTNINLQLNFTVQNQTASGQTFTASTARADNITSPALDPSSISAFNPMNSQSYLLSAHQFKSGGPIYRAFTAHDSVAASDPRLVNFMGTGTVDFDYESSSTQSFKAGIDFLPIVKDTVRFSITYLYCLTSLLSQDLLFFNATAQGKGEVLLNWRQMNIDKDRIYNLQVSTDGRNFKKITTVNENSSGNYSYNYFHNATARLYFRIEEKEISGEIKYSEVRIIDPTPTPGVQIYPTLYTGGNLQINFPVKADWSVNVYSAEGRRVAESKQANTGNAQITLPGTLSNGTYTAEVINVQTQQKQFARFVVQR